jgi:hypothetical protein
MGLAAATVFTQALRFGRSWNAGLVAGLTLMLGTVVVMGLAWSRRWGAAARVALAAALLWYATTLQWLLPGLDHLWLSRTAAHVIDAHAGSASRPPVAAIGYHEPSLVFLIGTDLALLDAEAGAAFLQRHHEALVLVGEEQRTAFEEASRSHGVRLKRLWSGEGLNYSKGRSLRLHLYRRRTGPSTE